VISEDVSNNTRTEYTLCSTVTETWFWQ